MNSKELTLKNKTELSNGQEKTYFGKIFVPDVDIYEDNNSLYLAADMPGVSKENIEIELKDGKLTIEGRISQQDYEGLRPIYSEYNIGNYRRAFSIDESLDQEKIVANLENGTLKLILPKTEKARPKRITVN